MDVTISRWKGFALLRRAGWIVLIGLLCGMPLSAQDQPSSAVEMSGDRAIVDKTNPPLTRQDIYALGEKVVYNVTWNGKEVGQGISVVDRIVEKNGRKTFLIRTFTRANEFIQMFYPVEDQVESYVDVETLAPVFFEKRLREGDFHRDEYLDINDAENISSYYRKKGDAWQLKARVWVPERVQDPLSVMFYLRGMEFEVGKSVELLVVDAKATSVMAVKVVAREEVEIRNVGKFDCYKLIPTAEFEGLFKRKKSEAEVWIDVNTRIPVKATASVPFGDIVFTLDSVSNVYEEEESKKAPADRWWK